MSDGYPRNGVRWTNGKQRDGDTFCVKRPSTVQRLSFVWNGYKLVRTAVKGVMNSKNIRAACQGAKLKPACGSLYNADGMCIPVQNAGSTWYMSNVASGKKNGLPVKKIRGAAWYMGSAYADGRSIMSYGSGDKWTTAAQQNGDTYCVKQPDRKKQSFTWDDRQFIRTAVKGEMTKKNILAACKKVAVI